MYAMQLYQYTCMIPKITWTKDGANQFAEGVYSKDFKGLFSAIRNVHSKLYTLFSCIKDLYIHIVHTLYNYESA